MSDQEINLAFENRWRIKGREELLLTEEVKSLCRDFFEAGILLADNESIVNPTGTIQIDTDRIPEVIPQDKLFDYWWSLYGKKIDRAKCEKKWKKLTIAEKEACIAATPAYVASTPELQFRRHPATYLNNKSWENQIIPRNNGTDKQAERNKRIAAVADRIAEYTKDTD